MTEWDGPERRKSVADGRDGRRLSDWHCGDHHAIQDATREHRGIVCNKIKNLKEDSEKDVYELKAYHDKDMETIKVELADKAEKSDFKSMIMTVKILVVLCCAIVSGTAVWLKADLGTVASSIQRLNIRLTEATNDRVNSDFDQSQKLESISGQINVIGWRLSAIEDSHKNEVKK